METLLHFTVEETKVQRGEVTCPTQIVSDAAKIWTQAVWLQQPWLTLLYTLPNWLILGISLVLATTLETELEAILSKDQFPSSLCEERELGSKRNCRRDSVILAIFSQCSPGRELELLICQVSLCPSNLHQSQPLAEVLPIAGTHNPVAQGPVLCES